MISVVVLNEAGYDQAAIGFSLSYNSTPERAKELFPKFALRSTGENKFLESMVIWVDVTAPRNWWQQADTYRMSSKQSGSTMHTATKRHLIQNDFYEPIPEEWLDKLNQLVDAKDLIKLKRLLPESFLQRRVWFMSYKTLQNIYMQRKNHKLQEWNDFLELVLNQIEHPQFIKGGDSRLWSSNIKRS